ncbi:MAG TPA: GNAT family protein [Bacillota bacterium]|nr:GNAT family protein [Bacillota bacterium]
MREFAPGDAGALQKVYGDPDTTRHLSFEPRSAEQVRRIVTAAIESASAPERVEYMLAVAEDATGELVGAARLALGEYESAQIGFALRPDQWGAGKGQETVRLLLRLGFSELGLHRLWGARSPLNEASARTMQSAGMVEEGRIRGHLFTRGAWRDSIVHSVLSDEYAAAQSAARR